MLYGKYTFCSSFDSDAILPEFKGSTFRGVFGHALKKVVCALKRRECGDCPLGTNCVYPFVFETRDASGETNVKKRIAAPPRPYVIEPMPDIKTRFLSGESFDFNLLLFGKANEYLPYFIYAFDQMGKPGIGKHISKERASFTLRTVSANGRLVYSSEDGKIRNENVTENLADLMPFLRGKHLSETDTIHALTVTLLTPVRIKYENRFDATLPFHILVRAMLRRVSSLCEYYGDGEPKLDYRGLVDRAKNITMKESAVSWFDWRRYSNRQDQAMLMGGMIGKVVYEGNLGEFLPLLRFCEKVHLGKQTTFGLGKIGLTVNGTSAAFP